MNAVRDETITQSEHELGAGLSKADSNRSAEVVARKSVPGTFRKRGAGHAVGREESQKSHGFPRVKKRRSEIGRCEKRHKSGTGAKFSGAFS
jgi:hypothetical protein